MRVCPRKVTQSPQGYIIPVRQRQCAAQLRKYIQAGIYAPVSNLVSIS